MRLGIFSDNFFPETSGVSDSILLLGQELAGRGHTIFFYVPRYGQKDYAQAGLTTRDSDFGPNIMIRRFFAWPFPAGTGQGRLFIPGPRAWRRVALDQPDLLYVQQPFGTGHLALKAARKLKIPLLGTNHTAVSEFIKYQGPGSGWIKRMALKYFSWYYNHCQLVTGPSQWVYSSLAPAGLSAPYRVISNPLDFNIFFPVAEAKEAALREELKLSPDTISFAGRLSSEKKINILIQATALVKAKFPNVNLALAGNGQDSVLLKKMALDLGLEENVKFLGRLTQMELAKVFQASVIFVTASTSETQGMTVLQAMACGRAVIGVRSLALPEYISGHNGFLVEPDNPQALAGAIIEFLSDRKRCADLGQGGREDVQKYSRQNIADTWENIFQSAIKADPGQGK